QVGVAVMLLAISAILLATSFQGSMATRPSVDPNLAVAKTDLDLPTSPPTSTPCFTSGPWVEQSPHPIAVSGQAVPAQGGNIFSFGGIANNVAITNANKYSPGTNTWVSIASLPAPRGWFSATSDGTYIYLLGGVDENFANTATLWRYDPTSNTYNTSLP